MSEASGTALDRTTFAAAEEVASVLSENGVACALIGAGALAVHGYPRATSDLDLATDTDPFSILQPLAATLGKRGYKAEFFEPDADDSLGGLLRITRPDILRIEVVNFYNPLSSTRTPAPDAIRTALEGRSPGSPLRVVDLPHLIALKLYSGSWGKALNDVIELLERNRDYPVDEIRAVCARHGLADRLDELLKNLQLA